MTDKSIRNTRVMRTRVRYACVRTMSRVERIALLYIRKGASVRYTCAILCIFDVFAYTAIVQICNKRRITTLI